MTTGDEAGSCMTLCISRGLTFDISRHQQRSAWAALQYK